MAAKGTGPSYFVTQTNPEIFTATPRPGGLMKIDIPPKPSKLIENAEKVRKQSTMSASNTTRSRNKIAKLAAANKSQPKQESQSRKSLLTIATKYNEAVELDADSCPREFKVKQIIAATPWSVEFDEFSEALEERKRIPDPFQDSVDMLAMAISVIMLLSRGYTQLSNTHFKWVISYLDCIKDEYGRTPPNVQGLLNHINQITGGNIKSFLEEEDYEPPELDDRAVRISNVPPTVAPADAPADG